MYEITLWDTIVDTYFKFSRLNSINPYNVKGNLGDQRRGVIMNFCRKQLRRLLQKRGVPPLLPTVQMLPKCVSFFFFRGVVCSSPRTTGCQRPVRDSGRGKTDFENQPFNPLIIAVGFVRRITR